MSTSKKLIITLIITIILLVGPLLIAYWQFNKVESRITQLTKIENELILKNLPGLQQTANEVRRDTRQIVNESLFWLIIDAIGSITIVILLIILIRRDVLHPLQYLTKQLEDNKFTEEELRTENESSNEIKSLVTKLAEKFYKIIYFDSLSSLPTRSYFRIYLEPILRHAKHDSSVKFALLIIDMNGLDKVNQLYGTSIGDDMVRTIAKRLTDVCHTPIFLSRHLNKDFIIYLPAPDENCNFVEYIKGFVKQVFACCQQSSIQQQKEVRHDLQIGISLFPDDSQDLEELITQSISAIGQVNEAAEQPFHFYSDAINKQTLEIAQLENDLRYAIKQNEISLHYQAQVALSTNTIIGAEALMRWQHKKRGNINTEKFIAIANNANLSNQLFLWLLDESCKTLSNWRKNNISCKKLAINLTAAEFQRQDLLMVTQQCLEKHNLPAKYLTYEITEQTLMTDIEHTRITLHTLRTNGIKIAIDDFGTGYSSLNYLQYFPFDFIKIDKSFIDNIVTNQISHAIINSIITLAHEMRLKVIAEGVENQQQLVELQKLGCDEIQGFLVSKALPADEFINFIKNNNDTSAWG